VMHPTKPELNGTDLSSYSDKKKCPRINYRGTIYENGAEEIAHVKETYLFVEMNRVCSVNGEGEVRYYWPKPDEHGGATEEGYLKMSYVKLLPEWGWVLGTGEYMDEIDKVVAVEQNKIKENNASMLTYLIWGGVALVVVLGIFSWLNAQGMIRPVKKALDLAEAISQGDLSMRLNLGRHDEIGQMVDALDRMVERLESKARLAEAIADGDLTQEIEEASGKDKLGRSLKVMSNNLNNIVSQTHDGVERVAASAFEVSSSSQMLSQGATEQAAALEEISNSMVELGSRTRTNAENATEADLHATGVRDSAEKGNRHMKELVSAMEDIDRSSQKVSKIIKVIDDIAFQTNLLALNAAVEAARAGRHGKGFAVVAEEVRNLAGRSTKAAKETSELIGNSEEKVKSGIEVLNHTAEALDEIVHGVAKVTDLAGEIASASNEQAVGIRQINEGLSQIEKVTQQNTANAEETASAAIELSSQSNQIIELLKHFRLKSTGKTKESKSLRASQRQSSKPGPMQEFAARSRGNRELPRIPSTFGNNAFVPDYTVDHMVDPETVISLDDSEFGKF
ncbi:MAG: methyl-accepting chemotaxis protein, partial [Planctomycetota bacterium]